MKIQAHVLTLSRAQRLDVSYPCRLLTHRFLVRAPSASHSQLVAVHQYLLEYQASPTCTREGDEKHGLQATLINEPADSLHMLEDAALRTRCRKALDESVAVARAREVVSVTQQQVLTELRRAGLEPQEEFVDPATGYSIDAMVVCGKGQLDPESVRVAVEVDGPSHFLRTPSAPADGGDGAEGRDECRGGLPLPTAVGGTVMKHRHLRTVGGYAVVSVPFWEWDALNSLDGVAQRAARQRYLKDKLGNYGAAVRGEEEKDTE
jgi:hypothetical protein